MKIKIEKGKFYDRLKFTGRVLAVVTAMGTIATGMGYCEIKREEYVDRNSQYNRWIQCQVDYRNNQSLRNGHEYSRSQELKFCGENPKK